MNLITTTITLSIPEETIAECIGLPAVPDGSPSSLDRYWSPTWDVKTLHWMKFLETVTKTTRLYASHNPFNAIQPVLHGSQGMQLEK